MNSACNTRGALNNGVTKEEIAEVFLQVGIYAGVPAAVEAFREASKVFEEMGVLTVQAAADFLLAAHREGRRFERLPAGIAPGSEDEAYRVQERAGPPASACPSPAGRWRLTSAAMRRVVPGIDQPCAGAIFAERVHRSPARLPRSSLMRIGLECEAMVRLAGDLPDTGRPWTRESVAPHVGAVAAAFELIDDREADYNNMNAFELIADNAWNGGVVIGPEVSDWQALDLVGARGSLEIDGKPVGEGRRRRPPWATRSSRSPGSPTTP